VRTIRRPRLLGLLLALALVEAAGGGPAAGAFEVYCQPTGVNSLACQRLDEAGTGRMLTCMDDPSNIRTCTSPDGEGHTCVRSRGNVFSCESPTDGSPETSRCQFTGQGVYACQHDPPPPPQALPVVGPIEEGDDAVEDEETDFDADLMLDGLDD